MSQVGRIGGQLLDDNLLRAGVDLSVETDLLYLDVSNQKISINQTSPIYDLDVNSDTHSLELTSDNTASIDNIRINTAGIFTTSVGGIDVYIAGSEIFHDRLTTANLVLDGNLISSVNDSNIVFDPNGSGTLELAANTLITGNLAVSGNISMDGDLIGLSRLILGDQILDTVTVNTDFTQDILPGDDLTYTLGWDAGDSSPRRWAQLHSPDWTTITKGGYAGDALHPLSVTISGQTKLDGVNNQIFAQQSNEDVLLNPETGIVYIESLKVGALPLSLSLINTLDNPNAIVSSDNFGNSVAVRGSYAVIGAPRYDGDIGEVHVYNIETNTLLHTIPAPASTQRFGQAVDISDDYVIVGAPHFGIGTGRTYVYSTVTGEQLYELTYVGTGSGTSFGESVSISGNYAIVGHPGRSDLYIEAGYAYIYDLTTGTRIFDIRNPNPYGTRYDDRFGTSVSISGNYAIVSTPYEDELAGTNSGKAYIYKTIIGDWTDTTLLYTLDNPNAFGTEASDQFGYAVAIDGNYAIVSATGEDDAGGTSSGKAYIFNVTTGALVHTLDNPNAYDTSQSDTFGGSVAIDGNYAIVGASGEDDGGTGLGTPGGSGLSSGKAYVFNVTTGALLFTIDNPNVYNTSAGDSFGSSVAISSRYVIVGAYGEDAYSPTNITDSGKSYVYSLLDQSVITNLNNTSLNLAVTGPSYYRFAGDNGMLIPAGTDAERTTSPELGETRWNTDQEYLECFDGSVWTLSTGGGGEVTETIMNDLGNVWTLVLG